MSAWEASRMPEAGLMVDPPNAPQLHHSFATLQVKQSNPRSHSSFFASHVIEYLIEFVISLTAVSLSFISVREKFI